MRKSLYLALVTAVFFTAFPCFSCGEKAPKPSVGLEFTVSEDESYVEVTGMGDCEDTAVVIPEKYEGLPVVDRHRGRPGSHVVRGLGRHA